MTYPDCVCGHPHTAHTHLHDRDYCGSCGPDVCNAYRNPDSAGPVIAAILAAVGLRKGRHRRA